MIAAFPFFAAIGAILLILLNKLPITHTQMGVILVLALAVWFFLGALYFWQLDLPTPVLESIYPTHAPSTRRSNQDLIRAQDRRLAGILDRVILVLRDAVDARPRRLHPENVAGAVRRLVLRLRCRRDIALVLGRTVLTGAGPSAVRDGRQGPDGADAVRGRHRQVPAVERARSRCHSREALAVAVSAHPHGRAVILIVVKHIHRTIRH